MHYRSMRDGKVENAGGESVGNKLDELMAEFCH